MWYIVSMFQGEGVQERSSWGHGWFSTRIGALAATHIDHRVDSEGFAAVIADLDEDIATWPPGLPRAVLYDVPTPSVFGPEHRRKIAEVLRRHEETLARVATGFCLVTSSPIIRGVVTATFWLAPPRYPTHAAEQVAEGLAWLARGVPGADAVLWGETYKARHQEYLRRLAATG